MDFIYFMEEYSPEFISYGEKLKEYNVQKGIHFIVPLSTTLILAGTTTYTYFKTQNNYDEAVDLFDDFKFNNRPDRDEAFQDFEDARESYRKGITAFYIQLGATLVSSYLLYEGFKWKKKNQPPEYKENKNPLTLESVYLTPGQSNLPYSSGISLGLSFSLN